MKTSGRYIIGSLLAAAVIVSLLAVVDVRRSLELAGSAGLGLMLPAVAAYMAAHTFRALRFGSVLGDDSPSFLCLLSIVSIHNLLNQVMPVRTGEGAYPLLVKKVGGVGYAKGVSSLLLARAFDLAAFFAIFSAGLTCVAFEDAPSWARVVSLSAVAAAACLVFMYLGRVVVSAMRIVTRLAGLGGSGVVLGMDLAAALEKLGSELDRAHRAGKTGRLAFYSLSVWLTTFFMFYVFANGISGDVGFVDAVVGSSGAVLAGLLPVNSLGSIGTLEGGWLAGFSLVGLDGESALASGLMMHAFVIAFGALISAGAALFIGWRCREGRL